MTKRYANSGVITHEKSIAHSANVSWASVLSAVLSTGDTKINNNIAPVLQEPHEGGRQTSKHTVQGVFAAGSLAGWGPRRRWGRQGRLFKGSDSRSPCGWGTSGRGKRVLPEARVGGLGGQRPEDIVGMRLRGGQGSVWAVGFADVVCWAFTALPIVLGMH